MMVKNLHFKRGTVRQIELITVNKQITLNNQVLPE